MLPTDKANRYLNALVENLKLSETRYEQAYASYGSLGAWLDRENSSLREFKPRVYAQGSFALGTAIQPNSSDEEIDVDSVCELQNRTTLDQTQAELKELVRVEVESYRKSKGMNKPLKEGRRCWTLEYADGAQFHMDIVPAIPNGSNIQRLLKEASLNSQWVQTAISITDNESKNYNSYSEIWQPSNPKGYLEWFRTRMIIEFNRRRKLLAEEKRASVEDIPEYRVRTPLQGAIMILKRDRDIRFEKDTDHLAPISIIITTLAAHAYNGESDIASALHSIINGMERYIEFDGTNYKIRNPSYELENFADKWAKFPERRKAFYEWLGNVKRDYAILMESTDSNQIIGTLSNRVGSYYAKQAQAIVEPTKPSGSLLRGATAATTTTPVFGTQKRAPSKPQGFA
jgi:hypothetical protein